MFYKKWIHFSQNINIKINGVIPSSGLGVEVPRSNPQLEAHDKNSMSWLNNKRVRTTSNLRKTRTPNIKMHQKNTAILIAISSHS